MTRDIKKQISFTEAEWVIVQGAAHELAIQPAVFIRAAAMKESKRVLYDPDLKNTPRVEAPGQDS